jgi:hypothetical protein
MNGRPFSPWQAAFLQHVQDSSTAAPLKEAALAGQLAAWTTSLTTAVVRSCESLGWQAAGRGHPLVLLPQAGQEYLGIDVMAFPGGAALRWPLPLAAYTGPERFFDRSFVTGGLVQDGAGKDLRFWNLSQSLAALYPAGSDE